MALFALRSGEGEGEGEVDFGLGPGDTWKRKDRGTIIILSAWCLYSMQTQLGGVKCPLHGS